MINMALSGENAPFKDTGQLLEDNQAKVCIEYTLKGQSDEKRDR